MAALSVYDTFAAALGFPRCSTNDQSQFSVAGVPSLTYVVEASTNLLDWVPLVTTTPPFTFVDQPVTNCAQRFYRAVCRP